MKSYGHITGNTEKIFLFIFMNQMVQGDQLSKTFSAVLDHPPLTATPIYSNNQSKLLYMVSVTIFAVTVSEKIAKNQKKSDSSLQSHFTSEIGIMYFYVGAAAPWLKTI